MSCEFICDGCGKREPAARSTTGEHLKPWKWYQRRDADGSQDACSRKCIDEVAKKTGKTAVVLPV